MHHTPDLDAAVLHALSPRSTGERVRLVFSRGWSVMQVFERLNPKDQEAFSANDADTGQVPEPDVISRRRGIETLRVRLLGLVGSGKVLRRTGHYAAELKSKGPRDMVVDLFRLA